MAKDALITATISGADRRFTATTETTDDLPADAIGECVVKVLQQSWKAGNDPVGQIVVLEFSRKEDEQNGK